MFTKGPRFEPVKVPDVPGPNAYNVPAHTPQQPYKRGAFLEKAERFGQEKETDETGSSNPLDQDKKPAKPIPGTAKTQAEYKALAERYAALQRKVDDLEKVHQDGKKTHQEHAEKLKSELSKYQRLHAEQTERIEKQKKQIDLLEARVQDLKKTSASKEVEVKDLKLKLKSTEHERAQIASKEGETAEAKKSLEALESKRKEALKEKDRRIADLEKDLASERKKRELIERKAKDLEEKGGAELTKVRSEMKKVEAKFSASAQEALTGVKEQAEEREEELLAQLEQHKDLMKHVAKEYGRLASQSVPRSTHQRLQDDHTKLKLRAMTLERRLLNSESQVTELAYLIRQTKEKNHSLQTELYEMEEAAAFQYDALTEASSLSTSLASEIALLHVAYALGADLDREKRHQLSITNDALESLTDFCRLASRKVFSESLVLDASLREEQMVSHAYASTLSRTKATLEANSTQLRSLQEEKTALEGRLEVATGEAIASKASVEGMARQVEEMEEKMAKAEERCETAVKKEKAVIKECTTTIQKSKMAEEALRSEIDNLTTELAEASRYQEAYYGLSDEVGALLARNRLAEDEAQKLSKFNAEILGHSNPAQRILYVDRIRRELAEVKHDLVMKTRDHEAAVALSEELQHELDMYTSVAVPTSHKPRSNMTRVSRVPLGSHNQSQSSGRASAATTRGGELKENMGLPKSQSPSTLETIPGDMTLDEIS